MRRPAQCLTIDAKERPLLIGIPTLRAPDQYVCKVSDGLSVQRVHGLTRVPQRSCVCRSEATRWGVRHIETNCTRAQQNGGEQTGEEIEKTGANRSGPKPAVIQTPLSGPRYRGSNPCLPANPLSPLQVVLSWRLAGFDFDRSFVRRRDTTGVNSRPSSAFGRRCLGIARVRIPGCSSGHVACRAESRRRSWRPALEEKNFGFVRAPLETRSDPPSPVR